MMQNIVNTAAKSLMKTNPTISNPTISSLRIWNKKSDSPESNTINQTKALHVTKIKIFHMFGRIIAHICN